MNLRTDGKATKEQIVEGLRADVKEVRVEADKVRIVKEENKK